MVHDAHWVPADNPLFPNALSGYNNKGGTGSKTCVDIINPPYAGYSYSITPGTAFTPSVYTWRHTYSGNMSQDNGNSQQLPNGNTLVCIGMSGLIYEINASQAQVWSKSVGGTIAQAFRYPACFVTGTYTADASGSPASVNPGGNSQLNVTATGGVVYNYSWTSNPPGFTSGLQNPIVTPDVTTTYYVTIKNGPCVASDSVTITVGNIGIGENDFSNGIRVFPNPTTGMVSLSGTGLENRSFGITLFNTVGEAVMTFENKFTLDLSALPGGIYYLTVLADQSENAHKKILLVR